MKMLTFHFQADLQKGRDELQNSTLEKHNFLKTDEHFQLFHICPADRNL